MRVVSRNVSILASVAVLSLAGCGGSGEDEKQTTTAAPTQTEPAPTPTETETTTAADLANCIEERGAAQKLATRTDTPLTVSGLEPGQYETVAVDEDGDLAAQVLVFASHDAAAAGLAAIEKGGFFDDVRPGANAVIVVRGGSEPAIKTVQGCLPAA
jgi:septal ring-binding cell division protein DamX